MANKPTQPVFPLGLETSEQSTLAGIVNTGTIEHGPDAVMTLPEGNASAGLPSSVRYNADSDEFEGFYENGGWLPLGGGGIRWEVLPHASTAVLDKGRGYLIDNTTDVSTVVFPTPTRVGDSVTVCDMYGKFSFHPLTIDPNGHAMYGSTEPMTLSTDSVSATFTWSGDARGWIVTAGVGLGQGRVYSRTIFTETVASDTAQVTLTTQPSIVDVYVDGKRLLESKYSLNGFNVDFSPSIPAGSELQVIQYVPIQLGGGGGGSGGSTVITWIYNSGSAVGGETEIELDVDAEDVSEIYISGSRQQKGLGFNYDSDTKNITLADELEAGDEVVVVINGDPTLYNQIDRTPNEVARSTNVPVSQVILTSDTITKLDGKTVIYDVVAQKIWGLPSGIPTGASIISVSGSTLTYAPGDVLVGLLPVAGISAASKEDLKQDDGASTVGGSVFVVSNFAEAILVKDVKSKVLQTLGYFNGSTKGGSSYVKDGTTGTPSTGDASKFFDASGTGWKLATTTINYAQFGAVLDGVVNDTAAVVKAHTYSLSTGIPIVQVGGVAYVTPDTSTNQVVYNVDADYTGGFYFVTDSVTGRGFVVRDIASEVTLNQSDVTIAEFVVTRMKIPSLASYANYFAVLSSTEQDLNRKRDTGPAPQAKAQGVVLGDGGTLDAPLYTTFNSLSQIKLQSVLIPTITISGFCLKTRGGINIANPFGVQRNNVILKNFRYEDLGTSQTIPVQSLINVEFCYNVDIDGISSDPLSKGIVDYNYVINTWKSTKVRIRNMSGFDGWAQLDGNYCRDVIVEDSTIDRVGVHFRGYDYTFRNLNSRRGRCIAVTGGGSLVVNNVKVRIDSSISADEQYTAVAVRGDYGAEWDGTISIKDVVMDFTNFYSSTTGLVSGMLSVIVDSTVGAHDFGRTVVMPRSICVDNCTFLINNMPASRMRAVVVGCTSSIISGIVYPSNISVRNVNAVALGNVKYKIQALHWDTVNRSEVSRKDINIFLENVVNIDPALYNETVLDDPNSTVYIGTTGTNSRIKFYMVSCPWHSITTSGSYIEGNIHGGGVHYFNSVANTGTRLNFKGVDFYGTRFRGTGKVTIQDSIFRNYIDKDSASVAIGNGQNVDSVVTFIQGTATETGATLTGTAITVALAKTGYAQSGYFQ